MKVRDLSTAPRTIESEASLQEAARGMERWHVGSLVVLDQGKPTGMITDRDLALFGLIESGADSAKVRDCMRMPLVTIDHEATVGDAAHALRENGVRRLALQDGEKRIVGVVSADDLLQAVGRHVAFLTSTIHRELSAEADGHPSGSNTYGSE